MALSVEEERGRSCMVRSWVLSSMVEELIDTSAYSWRKLLANDADDDDNDDNDDNDDDDDDDNDDNDTDDDDAAT
ncbi:hypothetical protein M0802_007366 [Mischocyttarus mexicanus]|nr:hypothetical protein M0802_007366 [Mischocyttarus mexicanus]